MMTSDEILNIDTPENIVFDYEVVGIGSRFLAALIDTIIIGLFQAIVLVALFAAQNLIFDGVEIADTVLVLLFGLVAFSMLWGYYIFFEMRWNGSSPGKRATGLRVIRRDGMPITLTESIIRNLVRLVDFMPVAYGVGVIAMFVDNQSRRLGDMAANTIVVRDEKPVTLESLSAQPTLPIPSLRAPNAVESAASEWPIDRLSARDIQLAQDFLQRRLSLANGRQLAHQIMQGLLKRMDVPLNSVTSSESLYVLDFTVKLWQKQQGGDGVGG